MTKKSTPSRRTLLKNAAALGATRVLPGVTAYLASARDAHAWGSWSGYTTFTLSGAANPPRRVNDINIYDMGYKKYPFAFRVRNSDNRQVRDFQVYTYDEKRKVPVKEIMKMRINTRDGGNLNTIWKVEATSLDKYGNSVQTFDPFANSINQVIEHLGGRELSRTPSDASRSYLSRWHRLTPDRPLIVRGQAFDIAPQTWRLAFDFDARWHRLPLMAAGENAIHIAVDVNNDIDFRRTTGDVIAFDIEQNGISIFPARFIGTSRNPIPEFERLTSAIARTQSGSSVIYSFILDEPLTRDEYAALESIRTHHHQNTAAQFRLRPSNYVPVQAADYDVTPGTIMRVANGANWEIAGPHLSRAVQLVNTTGIAWDCVLVLTTYFRRVGIEVLPSVVARIFPRAYGPGTPIFWANSARNIATDAPLYEVAQINLLAAGGGNPRVEFHTERNLLVHAARAVQAQWVSFITCILFTQYFQVRTSTMAAGDYFVAIVLGLTAGVTLQGAFSNTLTLFTQMDTLSTVVEDRGLYLTRADGNRWYRTRLYQVGNGVALPAGGSLRNVFNYLNDLNTTAVSFRGVDSLPVFYDIGDNYRARLTLGVEVQLIAENVVPVAGRPVASAQIGNNTTALPSANRTGDPNVLDQQEAGGGIPLVIGNLDGEFAIASGSV